MKYVLWALSLVMLILGFVSISVRMEWWWTAGDGAFSILFAYLGCIVAFKSAVRSGKDRDRK